MLRRHGINNGFLLTPHNLTQCVQQTVLDTRTRSQGELPSILVYSIAT